VVELGGQGLIRRPTENAGRQTDQALADSKAASKDAHPPAFEAFTAGEWHEKEESNVIE
jgi:hypothetical protein